MEKIIVTMTEGRGDGGMLKFRIDHGIDNFPDHLLNDIKKISGVDSVLVLSRYSFEFKVGKCFDQDVVVWEVKNAMSEYLD